MYRHINRYIPFHLCQICVQNMGFSKKKANSVIFLSSGVGRKHRKVRDDLIALLLYGFSNSRYYKHNISNVLVYKR